MTEEQRQMKQTAVEWLVEKLNQCEPMYSGIQSNEHKEYLETLIEQAKEMEKEQHKMSFNEGYNEFSNRWFEKYYNETFKNETK
jgi:predicted secreted protein